MSNLIIKYGFQSIIPNFTFSNNKGFQLYESNHVFNVQEYRPIDGFCVITDFVVRQTNVSSNPYKVELEVPNKVDELFFIITCYDTFWV